MAAFVDTNIPIYAFVEQHDRSPTQVRIPNLSQSSHLSYWDSLIVEAARRSGASILYTEDMHHGTRYGVLEVRNRFLA